MRLEITNILYWRRPRYSHKDPNILDIYLVSKRFRGDNCHLVHDPLIGVEIQGELSVVLLDDQARSFLDGFRPNTSHFRV